MNNFFGPEQPGYVVVNVCSIVCSGIILGATPWLAFFRKRRSRVTLKLQAGIALVDFFRHVRLILQDAEDEPLCALMGCSTIYGDHLNMLLSVAIAANLHLVYLEGRIPWKSWARFLWVVPIVVASIIDVVSLGFGVYGKTKNNLCFISDQLPHKKLVKIYLLYVATYPGLIYCLLISTLILIAPPCSLKKGTPFTTINATQVVTNYAKKIALYPLSCFVSQVGFMIVTLHFDITGHDNPYLMSIAFLLNSTTGIVNMLCFLLDPSLSEAWHEYRTKSEAPKDLYFLGPWSPDILPYEIPNVTPLRKEDYKNIKEDVETLNDLLNQL